MLIAEHSMCQPGRPGPQGDPTTARRACRPSRARSRARPPCRTRRRPPARRGAPAPGRSPRACRSPDRGDAEEHRAVARVGEALARSALAMSSIISGDVLGGARVVLRPARRAGDRGRRRNDSMNGAVYSASGTPGLWAPRIVLSSTSVMFITWVTPKPRQLQAPAQQVLEQKGAQVADVDIVVDRRPAGVEADVRRVEGDQRFELATEGVPEDRLRAWRG